MHHRIDILRVPPAPRLAPMYVLYTGTNTQIQLYADRYFTQPIAQPISLKTENVHFYCAENARVDIKIFSEIYEGGFTIIRDQMVINPALAGNDFYTFLDGSLVLDPEGNIYQEAIE